jgi:hypothetical protein
VRDNHCSTRYPHNAHKWANSGIDLIEGNEFWCDGKSEVATAVEVESALPQLPRRFIDLMDTAMERFAEGFVEYGEGAADELGIAGQWGDLNRKAKKLKGWAWNDGPEPTRESPTEILQDIIGHCLLTLDMIERGLHGGRQ